MNVDWRNRVVDIFVKKDTECPYPWLIADPQTHEAIEAHEGLGFEQFEQLYEQMTSILNGIRRYNLE